MIRIYDKEEKIFSNLGLGSLDETLAAVVVEELNGSYELEIQYPLKGRHFNKLQLKNIIFCKPNIYTREQPFRIYSITKPIDGKVTVNAEHISYDASGVTILPKRNTETKVIESFGTKVTHNDEEGYFLDTILTDIKVMSVLPTKNYFNLIRGSDKENIFKKDGYSIPAPTNLRSMLGGDSGSILEKFKGEYLFDRFDVILKNKRGVDRGLTIRYGKNMTDIEHESEGNNLFTAIFPFYSKNYTETQQTTKPIFQETYIIEGVTPLRADWLSIELIDVSKGIGGINLKPVVEVMKVIVDGIKDLVERYAPVRVKTPNDPDNPSNDFYDKIYVFKRNTEEDGNLIKAYVSQKHVEQITVNDELKDIEVITELKLNPEDVTAITPVFGKIYVIQSDNSEHYNRKMIWDKGAFAEYSSDGFYVEAKDATLVDTLKDLKPIPTYPISWDEVNSKWIRDYQNGFIYVEPKKPNIGTVSVDKYVYVDLLEYELHEESNVLLENGVMYVNETLKNLSNQKILTLDLTGDIDSIDNLEPTDITSQHLFDKAEQYLKDNDLTKLKESITISFIKLSDSPEYDHLKALEIVELGDEINVIYEELGINSKHRVIATHYNVLTDSYDEIELGEKTAKITNNIVSSGDNISSLNNDAEYTEKTYVVNFVAENANIINAEIQKAIIQTLEASNVNISGLLVASHATIDDLVSQMLVTDNAKISELLEAGSVRVRGKITALSGEIGGCKIEDGKLQVTTSISIISEDETKQFEVNENGEVTANSITITGGSITIGKIGEFYTENVFEVTSDGKLIAKDAEIEGSVIIKEGSIKIGGTEEYPNFEVTNDGHIVAKSAQIGDGYINEEGHFVLPSANITGVLTIGQLPEEVAVTDDIPTAISELDNDAGFKDETGVTTIIDGMITTDYIEALEISVAAAKVTGLLNVDGKIDAALIEVDDIQIGTGQITGVLTIGQIPDTVAEITDIPTNVSELINDSGYKNAAGVTTIIDGRITADFIEALEIIVQTAQITGTLSTVNIDIGSGNFIVNSDGDVTIRSGSINIGDGKFIVDENGNVSAESFVLNTSGAGGSVNINGGKLTAENAEISGQITTDVLNVDEVFVKDVINLKLATIGTTTTRSYTVTSGMPIASANGGGSYTISVTARVNNQLFYNHDIAVHIKYNAWTYEGGVNIVNTTIYVPLKAVAPSYGTVNVTGSITVYDVFALDNITKTGTYPTFFQQTSTTGGGMPGLAINSHFVPFHADNNQCLGQSGNYRWNIVYAKTGAIDVSDERQKKEISYDISDYEEFFDRLKPSVFKFKDGTSGRKHLGFIAQDIRDALIDSGIDTKDFAGYIKDLLPESREKPEEDLTEDDYEYGLRYSELHALQIQQIQLLKAQIKLLEDRIKTLEDTDEDS